VANYAVEFIIDDDRKRVSVTRVAHRREVYEQPPAAANPRTRRLTAVQRRE